jgi:capsular exopolysaccharide synthesis family protein
VQQQIGAVTVCGTPRAVGRRRKSPADIILSDNRSAFSEAFRVSWANVHLALAGPRSTSFRGTEPGAALGITSAASGEGKSTHALGLARTAALAGEKVVLVDADLRRPGVTRLLDQDFRFTLRDFLDDRATANEVIATEERSGVHVVPSIPANVSWTKQDLQRFFDLVDYLKGRYAIVIIDLPPILGLAETIRLATAADSVALVIRWGRTERQFVQSALHTLRTASVSTIAVFLNDIDLKAQRRRGYRDHTVVYTDKGLYQAAAEYGEPVRRDLVPIMESAMEPARPDRNFEPSGSGPRDTPRGRTRPAGSDIERLYNRYHD